ncbi:hypothetical protein [Aquimarina algicola]|uniref:Uncharacterized protein n=1 Tax=Aquimarina algicola TaxID=2589995 RepID=A0A504JM03_9FLAO|nr:hypothetical protein [Aquimarina algicola]TPN87681.1 hypothetical protein FHK87_08885 [Aquimarina algicola]
MHTAVKNPIALGVIGIQEKGIQFSEYQTIAFPEYKKRIRVHAVTTDFTAKTFSAYSKVSKNDAQQVKYIDSIKRKPKFLNLELLDRITTIAELQEDYNSQTYNYLKGQQDITLVTNISMAVSQELIREIEQAETIFLKNGGYKQYQLELLKDHKTFKTILFSDTAIFAYGLSFFCWSENDKRQMILRDLVQEHSSCPKNTYQDTEKATQKTNYFKL